MHALIERPFHEDVFAFAFLRHWAHAHVRSTGRGSMRMGFAVGFVATEALPGMEPRGTNDQAPVAL